jgi:bifunctional DNA-binding transcriptional regulator/antitoxin component of YhaV-PrlF toxin-antitoxin module
MVIVTVESNAQGRLVIPAEVRAALNVAGKAHWQLEVHEGAIILKPAVVIPREDAWAYRPEHLARLEEAMTQARSGQMLDLSADQLERLTHKVHD